MLGFSQLEEWYMARSMFDRYGGFVNVSKIVMHFYDKVIDSDVIGEHFVNTDLRRLIDHQTKFICSVMGGPASYSNDALERIHANTVIDQAAFEEMASLLTESFEDFDVEQDDIDTVISDLRERSRFIINA